MSSSTLTQGKEEPGPSSRLIHDIQLPLKFTHSHSKSPNEFSSKKSLSDKIRGRFSTLSKRQWLLLLVFAVANSIAGIIYSIKGPFYPPEATIKGLSPSEFGFVFGIFELTKVIVCPVYGKYMSKFGPKRVFIFAMMLIATCSIAFGLLDKLNDPTTFLILSLMIRVFEAIGSAGFSTASFSIIAAEFPNSVATTFASLETFFGIGLIIGPLLGGLLFTLGGYQSPFILTGIALFFIAMIISSIMPSPQISPEISERTKPPSAGYNIFAILRIPGVMLAGFSVFSLAASTGYLSLLEPHISQFNLTPLQVGEVFVIYGTVYALTAPIWGLLCDRVSQPNILTLAGAVMNFIAFLIIGPAPFFPFDSKLWLTCIGLVFHGLALGATFVSGFVLTLRYSIANGLPNNMATYGAVSGIWTSILSLGMFVGPSLGGILFDQVGFAWGSLFILVLMAILFVLIIIFLFKNGMYITKSEGLNLEDKPLIPPTNSPDDSQTSRSSKKSNTYGAA